MKEKKQPKLNDTKFFFYIPNKNNDQGIASHSMIYHCENL